jgi:excisionase family DNA binding protein
MAKAKKKNDVELETKILDVDASMQGTIAFRDPVNLRINGSFEGKLDTRGSLSIGENAIVHADITGDKILIAGKVYGNIHATTSVSVVGPAQIEGDIITPGLSVTEGAVINGKLDMQHARMTDSDKVMTLKEVARYLEVETAVLEEWAQKKKIPAFYEDNHLKFRKAEIDRWIQEEKVNV